MHTVYLIAFERPIPGGRAQHYVGVTKALEPRLQEHRRGNGVPLFRVAKQYGIDFQVARTWEFDAVQEAYDMERWLKEMHQTRLYCPHCTDRPRATNGAHHGACERYAGRLAQRRYQYERYVELKRGGVEHGRIREIMRQEKLNGIERKIAA